MIKFKTFKEFKRCTNINSKNLQDYLENNACGMMWDNSYKGIIYSLNCFVQDWNFNNYNLEKAKKEIFKIENTYILVSPELYGEEK